MYPLKIRLIGLDETTLPHIRREVLNYPAEIDAEYTSVRMALQPRDHTDEKHLLLVHVPNSDMLADLRKLNGSFAGNPIIAFVPGKDADFLIAAMRAGAVQVVPLPLGREDFHAALECVGYQFGFAHRDAQVIAVCGATGGCGATTIAINLGYEIAQRQLMRTILMELSLRMGILAVYLDVEPSYTTVDLLQDVASVDVFVIQKALTKITDYFHVMPGPFRAIAPHPVSGDDVAALVDKVKKAAQVVVLDVPCTYDEMMFRALSSADHVVIVAEQKIPSIRSMQMIREVLARDKILAPTLVINRYCSATAGFDAEALEKTMAVPKLWTVADDPSVGHAVNNGHPLRLENERSGALADIDHLVDLLRGIGSPRESTTFFDRLLHAVGLQKRMRHETSH